MNNYYALVKTEQEPEYKINPPLAISSVGTEIKKNINQMPDGSSLLTDTGNNSSLKSQGINYIIHAVPRHRDSCASDEEFIEIAVKAAQNSVILADREGIEKLAFCLIGGERYRGSCDPEKLAKGLVNGALNQLEKCQNLKRISFIDWGGSSHGYFLKAYNEELMYTNLFGGAVARDGNGFGKLKSDPEKLLGYNKGDLCDKTIHGANAIVNSENAGMGWGGGISGAIKEALGEEASNVDQQRKDLMKEFNRLINGEEEEDNSERNDNTTKISFQIRYAGPGNIVDCWGFWKLDSNGNIEKDRDGYSIFINISNEHPVLKNPPYFWKDIDVSKQIFIPFKITIKKTDKDKEFFEKDDFFEIEEIKRKEVPNQNSNGGNDQNSDDQNGDENPNNDNGSNGNKPDKKKGKNLPSSDIPNSVKEYFQKNGVKSIKLDGKNWIIAYKNKKGKTTHLKTSISQLQGLEDYLKSQGIKILTDKELENSSSASSSTSKGNETKYWPLILGIGVILVIGVVVWMVRKNQKKNK